MQILSRSSRSTLHLLRRPILATSPAPMRRLSSPSRPFLSFMAFAPARWWPSALEPEVSPPNPSTRRVLRFAHGTRYMASSSGVEGHELGKPDRRLLIFPTNNTMISLAEHSDNELIARYGDGHPDHSAKDERRARVNAISGDEDDCRKSLEILDSEPDIPAGVVCTGCCAKGTMILPSSSHRDGSIYKAGTHEWKEDFRVADRTETRLEAMMFSDPRDDCYIRNGWCLTHAQKHMLQIFSVKLSKILVDHKSVELYGYIAIRDNLDPLLNYVFNCSRDESVIVEQGSLLNMTGPKRGIEMYGTILIEYDLRVKIGEQEKDDLQLIDGASIIDDICACNCRSFKCHIHGDCGVIDITAAHLYHSVEATVVVISEVQGSFSMCLDCFSSGVHEEIRLFDGAVSEYCALKRSVVAVVDGWTVGFEVQVRRGLMHPC